MWLPVAPPSPAFAAAFRRARSVPLPRYVPVSFPEAKCFAAGAFAPAYVPGNPLRRRGVAPFHFGRAHRAKQFAVCFYDAAFVPQAEVSAVIAWRP